MDVTVVPTWKQELRHQRLIDSTGLSQGPFGPRSVVLERDAMVVVRRRVALVDKTILTEGQTEQAIRDSGCCGCGKCMCCKVAMAAGEARRRDGI